MTTQQRPNIVYINFHDTGRHFGCYGQKTVQSPNIDQLAEEGVLFEEFFNVSPKCSPSRGCMLTGRYPQSTGLLGLCHGNFDWQLCDIREHLSHLLHEGGYFTTLQGFQHEVHKTEKYKLGFDVFNNEKQEAPTWQVPPCDVIAEGAVEFFRSNPAGEKPFFMQIGFFETHRPYDFGGVEPDEEKGVAVPPLWQENDIAKADFAHLQGSIKKADEAVGVILDGLKTAGLEENTIVVFSVDHGIALPTAKATLYDGGLEIPFIIRWPEGGVTGGKRSDRLVSQVDFVPTLFEMIGLETPDNIDGLSFADEMGDWRGTGKREYIHGAYLHETRCVRSTEFKYIQNYAPICDPSKPVELIPEPNVHGPIGVDLKPLPQAELYDLEKDPYERINLAGEPEYAGQMRRHRAELQRWMQRVDDPCLKLPQPDEPRGREVIQRLV